MGIKEDYDTLKKIWPELSPPIKLISAILFLINLGAIASLAETVADLRGFIVTAVHFYRMLTSLITQVWSAPQITIDAFSVLLLLIVSQFLASVFAKDRLFWPSPGSKKLIFWVILIMVLMKLFFTTILDKPTGSAISAFVIVILILLWDFVRGYCGQWNSKWGNKLSRIFGLEANETSRLQSRYTIYYITTAVLLFAIIAAISEGIRCSPS